MTRITRICGVRYSCAGVIAIILYLVDRSIAALDGYVPGEDYPVYTEVPDGLSFTCNDKIPGYYADPETMCQVWHWCVPSIGGNIKYSFLCGPGTVFNQRLRVCDWFFKTDCPNAQAYYGINEDLYKDEAGNYINGKKGSDKAHEKNNIRRLEARKKRQQQSFNKNKKRETNRQTRQRKHNELKHEIKSIDFDQTNDSTTEFQTTLNFE